MKNPLKPVVDAVKSGIDKIDNARQQHQNDKITQEAIEAEKKQDAAKDEVFRRLSTAREERDKLKLELAESDKRWELQPCGHSGMFQYCRPSLVPSGPFCMQCRAEKAERELADEQKCGSEMSAELEDTRNQLAAANATIALLKQEIVREADKVSAFTILLTARSCDSAVEEVVKLHLDIAEIVSEHDAWLLANRKSQPEALDGAAPAVAD